MITRTLVYLLFLAVLPSQSFSQQVIASQNFKKKVKTSRRAIIDANDGFYLANVNDEYSAQFRLTTLQHFGKDLTEGGEIRIKTPNDGFGTSIVRSVCSDRLQLVFGTPDHGEVKAIVILEDDGYYQVNASFAAGNIQQIWHDDNFVYVLFFGIKDAFTLKAKKGNFTNTTGTDSYTKTKFIVSALDTIQQFEKISYCASMMDQVNETMLLLTGRTDTEVPVHEFITLDLNGNELSRIPNNTFQHDSSYVRRPQIVNDEGTFYATAFLQSLSTPTGTGLVVATLDSGEIGTTTVIPFDELANWYNFRHEESPVEYYREKVTNSGGKDLDFKVNREFHVLSIKATESGGALITFQANDEIAVELVEKEMGDLRFLIFLSRLPTYVSGPGGVHQTARPGGDLMLTLQMIPQDPKHEYVEVVEIDSKGNVIGNDAFSTRAPIVPDSYEGVPLQFPDEKGASYALLRNKKVSKWRYDFTVGQFISEDKKIDAPWSDPRNAAFLQDNTTIHWNKSTVYKVVWD
jgi:hypothetical protein